MCPLLNCYPFNKESKKIENRREQRCSVVHFKSDNIKLVVLSDQAQEHRVIKEFRFLLRIDMFDRNPEEKL